MAFIVLAAVAGGVSAETAAPGDPVVEGPLVEERVVEGETGLEPAAETEPTASALVGHGGPIKGVAASPDGVRLLTASFDYSLGLWRRDGAHVAWLEGHDAAANAAVFMADGARAVSGGDDYRVILWDLDAARPLRRFEGHDGKVLAVALSPDGAWAASAAWDGTIGLWPLDDPDAAPRFLDAQGANSNTVAFSADGARLFSAGDDGRVLEWDWRSGAIVRVLASHGFGVNVLALDEAAGWLAYGSTDGVVRVVGLEDGVERARLSGDRRPILSLAVSADGAWIAYGDGQGYITTVATADWRIEQEFRAARAGPIWALDFVSGETPRLLAGGLDDFAALWPVGAGEAPLFPEDGPRRFHVDPEAVSNGERQFARKCSVCHTLTPDGARRAGPTLYAVFGRRAGTVPGYPYSSALTGSDLVWTEETLDQLFDVGPDHFTPGSKMPMQRIVAAADRADLIAYLRVATAPDGETEERGPATE